MSIEPIKILAELVIALFTERKRHSVDIFQVHIVPCYEAAKGVFEDYMKYYNELEEKLCAGSPLEDIALFVKARRLERLSFREELRATFESSEVAKSPSFDKAVFDLVSGSQYVNHEFGYFAYQIQSFIDSGNRNDFEEDFRYKQLITIRHQQEFITKCYQNIAKEYVKIRNKVLERRK